MHAPGVTAVAPLLGGITADLDRITVDLSAPSASTPICGSWQPGRSCAHQ